MFVRCVAGKTASSETEVQNLIQMGTLSEPNVKDCTRFCLGDVKESQHPLYQALDGRSELHPKVVY